ALDRPRHRRAGPHRHVRGARREARRDARGLAPDRRRRLDAERTAGRPVRQDGQAQGLPRLRDLGRRAAPRRDEDQRDDHRREHGPGSSDLRRGALRRRRRPLRRRRRAGEARVSETRQTFAGLSHWEIVFWYGLIVVSTGIFVWGVARLVLRYRRGRQEPFELQALPRRLARAAGVVLTHRWIRRRDPVAGLGHALIFYGFLVLFSGTAILAFQDDVAKPLLGFDFWRGSFYLGYSLILDVFGLGLALGLGVMAVKRLRRPAR